MPMTTQWGQREVTDSHLRINALFSVSSVAATGVWLVSLSIIGKKVQLVCQCHCHFTDLLVSLSIGASGTILQSHRGWSELLEFFTGHILVGGRAWDGQSDSNGASQKLSFDASKFWPIWITTVWGGARLSWFGSQSLSEPQGWKFTGSDNIGGWHVKKPMLWSVQFTSRIDLFMSGFTWSADQCKIDGHTITHEFCRRRQNTKFNPCQW